LGPRAAYLTQTIRDKLTAEKWFVKVPIEA
jgi:hypothetical protein